MGFLDVTRSYFIFCGLHLVCFALALTVCGLYGKDVNQADGPDKYVRSKWVYAVVIGALSALTCVVYFVPPVLRHAGALAAAWNAVLFILWIAVFGVFGAMYIKNPGGGNGVQRMKNAVWVDLVSALLWLASALAVFVYWRRHRDVLSQFTGRAHV